MNTGKESEIKVSDPIRTTDAPPAIEEVPAPIETPVEVPVRT